MVDRSVGHGGPTCRGTACRCSSLWWSEPPSRRRGGRRDRVGGVGVRGRCPADVRCRMEPVAAARRRIQRRSPVHMGRIRSIATTRGSRRRIGGSRSGSPGAGAGRRARRESPPGSDASRIASSRAPRADPGSTTNRPGEDGHAWPSMLQQAAHRCSGSARGGTTRETMSRGAPVWCVKGGRASPPASAPRKGAAWAKMGRTPRACPPVAGADARPTPSSSPATGASGPAESPSGSIDWRHP